MIDVDLLWCREWESGWCPNILRSILKFFPNGISHEENMVGLFGFRNRDGCSVVEVVVWRWARIGGGIWVIVGMRRWIRAEVL